MESLKESRKSKLINVWIPIILCVPIFLISLIADLLLSVGEPNFWLQRSGAIITILGAWIAFHESRESMKTVGGSLHINTKLPYRWLSLFFIAVGTVLWGYGDLPFK
jgi:hypothetical protein